MSRPLRHTSPFRIILIMVTLMLIGAAMIPMLNIQYSPSIRQKGISVYFGWNGASARVVEQEVTSKIEGTLASLSGIQEMYSSSYKDGGSVSLAVGMAHIFSKIPFMEDLMAYWYHFAIMFEAVFILTAVDAGTRVGRFFLQEMMGKVWPKFADKEWWPGIIITSVIFTGAWGYLVYSGDIGSIWPLFGICNQLLASVTLLIGTTVILRMNKTQYAWITGVPGVFMTIITFWAGIWLVVNQYLPAGQYLLAVLSVLVMFLMLFVIVGTVRRWIVLLGIHTTVKDEYGDEVKVLVAE